MIYGTTKGIQIGDIEAFKKMIEDAIHQNKVCAQNEELNHFKKCATNFSHNDKHYQMGKKVKLDATDS